MKKLYQLSHIFLLIASTLSVANAQRTICASGVTINATNYNLKGVFGTEVFTGAPYFGTNVTDLGVLTALSIDFARHDINRSAGCAADAIDHFEYRIYPVGDTPPAFTSAALTGDAMDIGVCTAPDNFHKKATLGLDLFPASECGLFQIDIRNTTFASGMGCTDTTVVYSATFSVAGALTLTAESVTTSATCGEELDVTIKISNSPCELSVLQYSISWDPQQFMYVSNTPVDIDGDSPILGTGQTAMGSLTYSWADNTNPCNTVLSDGTLLLTVRFKALGCNATGAAVNITGNPLALEAYDCSFNEITVNAQNNVAVNIQDNTAPDFACPNNLTIECVAATDYVAAIQAWIDAAPTTATDDCAGMVPVVHDWDGMAVPMVCDSITVTFSATDSCMNTKTCVQKVYLQDTQAPTITTCPVERNVEGCGTDAITGPVFSTMSAVSSEAEFEDATNQGVVSDACGIVSVTYVDVAAGTCPIVVSRTWTITDACGNSTSCVQTINVDDTVNPTITTCPVTRNIEACTTSVITSPVFSLTFAMSSVAEFEDVPNQGVASDVCGIVSVMYIDAVGTGTCPIVVTRTWTLTDACGNSITCEQTINVDDNVAPTWTTLPGDLDVTLQCSNAAGIAAAQLAAPTATDNCDASPMLSKTSGSFVPSMACTQAGTYTNTWTVTDDCGNTSTVFTQVITIEDTTVPVAACSTSVTIFLDNTGNATLTPAQVNNGSSDNCTALGDLVFGLSQTAFDCGDVGPNVVTLTVTDACGNAEMCMSTVTVEDNVDPIAICQDITVELDGMGNATIDEDEVNNGSSDACGGLTFDTNNTAFTCADIANNPIIVTLTVTDANSNTATCTAEVTVVDEVNPVATCQDITVELDGMGTATIDEDEVNNGSSDACGGLTFDTNITNFTCADIANSPITVTLTVTDANGNTATCTAEVTVEDNVNPVATCQDITVQLDGMGNATITEDAVNDGSSDACGGLTFDTDITMFSCADVANNPITVTLTVTDANNNTATCTAEVTVEDNIPPVAICPMNMVQGNDLNQCNAVVTFTLPDPTDNCPGVTSMASPASGSTFAVGTTTVTVTATDASTNMHSCTFTVTVNDTQNPVAACPMDIVQDNDPNQCNAVVSFMLPASSDNCPGVTSAAVPPSGSTFPAGMTTVTVTATDAAMNTHTCTFTVTVNDTQNPVAACLPALFQSNDPDLCNAVVNFTLPASSDNCPGVTSAAVPPSGSTFPVGPTTVTVTATDASSNTNTCTFIITVNDAQLPAITCPMALTIECTADTSAASTGLATATDNCTAMPTIGHTNVITPGLCPQEYTIFRTWTAQDAAGNTATCGQAITVDDSTPPSLACPAHITVECDESTDPVNTGTAGATDNCDPMVTPGYNDAAPIPGACPQAYVFVRTWAVFDDCGNTATCTQSITVEDSTPPVITFCPSAVTIECSDSRVPGDNPALLIATATDNCDNMPEIVYADVDFTGGCPQEKSVLRTWTATDDCNNSTTCVQSIAIDDSTAPTADPLPALGPFACYADRPAADIADVTGETDNCSSTVTVAFIGDSSNPGCTGTVIRTYRLTDECGNTADITQIITINDNVPPTADPLPALGPYACYFEIPAANVNDVTGEADNCGGAVAIIHVGDSPNPGCTGTVIRTYRLEDQCGNTADITQTITINDNVAPTADPLDPLGPYACYDDIPAANIGDVTDAIDNCGGTVTVTHVGDDMNPGCTGTVTRTYRLEDECGNTADITQSISINDNVPPTAICQDIIVELDNDGDATITASQVNDGSSDNCGGMLTLGVSPSAFTCANVGANVVTLTVTDNCMNTASCTATVTVTLPGGDPDIPTVTLAQSAAIICSGDSYTLTLTPGMTNPIGTTYDVSWVITPAFGMPDPNLVTLGGDFGDVSGDGMFNTADLVLTGAIDNENINSVNITFTVTPKFGPCAGTPQVIVVLVRPLPQATGISPTPPAGVCSGSTVGGFTIGHNLGSGTTDPSNSIIWSWSGTNLTATPANGTDDGGGSPNALFVSATTLENTGAAATTATLSVIPRRTTAGLTCSGPALEVQIVVEPEPEVICPNTISATTTVDCDTTLTLTHPTLNLDPANCSASLSISFGNGAPAPPALPTGGTVTPGDNNAYTFTLGQTVVTYSVVDGAMNASSCTFVVNVADNDAPSITCPIAVTIECNADTIPGAMAPTGIATATDNCDPMPTIWHTNAIAPGLCPQEYIMARTWVAQDASGNTAVCTQVITVDDSQAPSITCPINLTVDCGTDTTTVATGVATALDNCSPTMSIGIGHNSTVTPGACPQEFTISRLWAAVDNCGNVATCIQTIEVQDTTRPVITCPIAVTVECGVDLTPGPGSPTGIATATDNCDNNPHIGFSNQVLTVPCPLESIILRTWTATDDCGNTNTCLQSITVDDSTPPVLTCPTANLTLECGEDDYLTEIADWIGTASATDVCDPDPELTTDWDGAAVPPLSCDLSSGLTITFTAEDACGNVTNCSRTVYLNDTQNPTITCPATDLVLECGVDNYLTEIAAWIATATTTDSCDASPAITTDWNGTDVPALSCDLSAGLTIAFTATDDCGHTAVCSRTVYLDDTQEPTITCPAHLTVQCDESTDPLDTGSATATDACDPMVAISSSDVVANGACPQEYSITRTWTATDACGNETTCVQTIEVIDDIPPTFDPSCQFMPLNLYTNDGYDCPAEAEISLEVGDILTTSDTWMVAGFMVPSLSGCLFDNCSADSEIRAEVEEIAVDDTALPCERTITVSFRLRDACGNEQPTLFVCIYNIYDNTAPTFTVPDDVTLSCEQDVDDLTLAGDVTDEEDNCVAGIEATYTDAADLSGCNGTGTILRTWTLSDGCGNTTTITQTITIVDETVPVITCPPNVIVNCEASTLPANTGNPTVSDACDPMPTVSSSDSSLPGDCPQEQTITRTWLAQDACGNTATCVQIIAVQDTTRPVIVCPGDVIVSCEIDHSPAQTGSATATDNCDMSLVILFTDEKTVGSCPQDTTISRRWIAVDDCGNIAICVQTITVVDQTAPALTCPANLTIACNADTSAVATGLPTVLDNCDPNPVVYHTNVITPSGLCSQTYLITRTWTTEDACGNTADCTQTINVQDIVPPVLNCPANVTIECDEDTTPGAGNPTGIATAADNCDLTPTVLLDNEVIVSGTCSQESTITRTWVAIDDCTNATACVQTITVRDRTTPVVTCPADATVECNTSILPAVTGTATAADNCDPSPSTPTYSDATTPGNCPQEYTITRTWSSTDDCGNTGTCEQTIFVDDSTLPTFTVPADITVYADNDCNYDASVAVTGDVTDEADNCGTGLQATFTDDVADGPCAGSKVITRTWSLNDGCGNVLTQNQIITVQDTLIPVFPRPDDVTLTTEDGAGCPSPASISLTADQVNPVATGTTPFTFTVHGVAQNGPTVYSDNCSSGADLKLFVWAINNNFDGNADDCYRQIRVTWRVYDDCGNFRQRQQIFTILENTPPTFTAPADVTLSCEDDVNDLLLAGDVTNEVDNCATGLEAVYTDDTDLSGCNGTGTILRTWTLTDDCGNTTTITQTITIVDETVPTLVCPPSTTVNCDDPSPTFAGTATATDNCDASPVVTFSDVSTQTNIGACTDQTYTITRTWAAVDACSNSTFCVQIIAVQDTTRPAILCPLNITINCEIEPLPINTGTAIATDNCDPDPGLTYNDIVTAGDCPQEKVIRRRWITVDNCANINACEHFITVQDTTKPVLTLLDITVSLNCNDDLSPAGPAGAATATDNCDANPIVEYDDVVTSGSCNHSWTITRTWTATDACGNTTTISQTISVQDISAPTIQCPDDVVIECDESLDPSVNTALGMAIAIDNCDPMPIVTFIDAKMQIGACLRDTIITRSWAALDNCNNASACIQTITKRDTQGPVVTCPADLTVDCTDDTIPMFTGEATATDNCGSATTPTFADDVTPGNCPQEYTIVRTWSSTDDCGNTGTCEQTIFVDDTTPPAIVCPAHLTVQCDESTDPLDTGEATATDDCGPVASISSDDTITDGDCPQERTITRTWTATDACGNATICVQTIEVIDDTPPTFEPSCQFMPLNLFTSNGNDCPADAEISLEVGDILTTSDTWTVAGFMVPSLSGCLFDNCSSESEIRAEVAEIEVDDTALPCNRTITVSFRLRDACGNEQPTLFVCIYNIFDNTAPTFTVPDDVTLSCEDDVDDLSLAGDVTDEEDNCVAGLEATYADDADLSGCNGTGTILRTWTLTDGCGNTTTITQTITIVDETAPVFLCTPVAFTVNCDDQLPTIANTPVVTDNCDPAPTVNFSDSTAPGGCPDAGTITRIWTAFDACGNQAIPCTQTITVQDTTKPVIICPLDITINCEVAAIPANTGTAIATDNCDASVSVTFLDTPVAGDCPQERVIERRWIAVDNCLNATACIQTITVQDTTRPVLVCTLPFVTLECSDDLSPDGDAGYPTVSDNCDATPAVVFDDLSTQTSNGTCSDFTYTITRTWTATDACGNVNVCEQVISVEDSTPPTIACPPMSTVECDEPLPGAIAIDNCDPGVDVIIATTDETPGGCPQEKTIVRTWVAIDACGNVAPCAQTIIVVDETAPVVTCPADLTVDCTDDTTPMFTGEATATDNCGSATTPTFADDVMPGNCPQEYTIVRTWSSTDDCGNTGTCEQTIFVDDSTPPTFTVPADITVFTDANCNYDASVTVTGDVTDEDDNCGVNLEATFADDVADGPCAGSKIITRTWSLNDLCGNVLTQNQIITVQDDINPTFPKPADMTLTTDMGANCPETAEISLTIDQVNPVATGNAAFTYTVHGLTIDGPTVYSDNCTDADDLKLFVWNIFEDWDGPADACQRNIRVLWRVYDDCGNFQQRQQIFTILENTPPTFTVPADVTLSCEQDAADLTLTGDVTDEEDNCAVNLEAVYSDDLTDLTGCNGTGTILRIWTLTDDCGNTTTITQTITVIDEIAPELTCPPSITVSCDDPSPTAAGVATATDNCDANPTIDFSDSSTQTDLGLCTDQSYTIVRTWTAFDACGNSADPCTQAIAVQDLVAPVITCPADATVDCEDNLDPTQNLALGEATAVDNCDPEPGVTYTDFSTPGACPQERTILRTWLAVDNCNNPVACTQTIVVTDNTPPAILCPQDTVINCEVDPTVAITGVATATDLCDGNPTVTHSDVTTPGACPTLRTIVRTWLAEDACGNTATCSQTIAVQDTTRPLIICPADITVQCNEGIDTTITGVPTLSDNCDLMLAANYIDNPLPPNGCTQVILRNWITADDCNNAAACSQTITVTDSQPPVLVDVVADVTVQCDDIPAVGTPTVSDNCDPNPFVEYLGETTDNGPCPDSYVLLRSWSLNDNCGNSTIFVQTITVQDTEAPIWVDVPDDITVECGAVPDPYEPIAEDNCDSNAEVIYDGETRTDGECADAYTLTRTWTAVDACGNTNVHIQTISVQDTQAPVWVDVPNDLTVECNAVPDPYEPAAEDNCDTDVEITFSETRADGDCPNRYVLTRTWMASDNCSNSTLHTQTITVTDNMPPTAVCQDITVELDQNGEVTVAETQVDNGSADNCGAVTLTVSPASFTCANLGTNVVTLTATDACGQIATCTANVTVTLAGGGTTLPTVALGQNPATMCSGDTYNLTLTPGINNAPGTEYMVSWEITPAFPSTPDPNLVTLGGDFGGISGNGMITTTDLDLEGVFDNLNVNSVIVTFTVTPKSNGCAGTPQVIAMTLRPLPQVTSISPIPPSGVCSGTEVGGFSIGHNLGTGGADASNSIIWNWSGTDLTATPANGTDDGGGMPNALFVSPTTLVNTGAVATTATLTVIPQRTTAGLTCSGPAIEVQIVVEPELQIFCEDDLFLSADADECSTEAELTHPTTNVNPANCPVTLQIGFFAGTPAPASLPDNDIVTPGATNTYTFAVGQTIVFYKAVDGNGNSVSCSLVVEVADDQAPVWITQAGDLDRTVECGDTDSLAAAQILEPEASDNCGAVTIVKTDGDFAPSANCPPVGTYTNTWTVVDAAGNTTTVFTQTITVLDTEAPAITCPDDLVLECSDDDLAAQIAAWLESAAADDACAGIVVPENDYDGQTIPTVSCDLSDGLAVTFTATDNCGNSAACSASIFVLDTEAPTINGDCALLNQYGNASNAASYIVATSAGADCPEEAVVNLEVGQEISDDYEITVGGVAVPGILGCLADNCTLAENLIARVVAIEESGNACSKIFDVRFVVEDACGNQSADTLRYILEVIDNTAPTFTAPADITVYLDNDCEADLSGTGDVLDAEDNCIADLQATHDDEIIPGQGASEYIIERTWTLTDGCGNSTIQVQFITVLDTIRPTFDCPGGLEVAPNAIGCTYVVDGMDLDPDDPSDNCGSTTATYDLDGDTEGSGSGSLDGVTFNEGTTIVTWTVTDGNGNASTCSFTVVVNECIEISGTLIWEGDDSDMTGVALAMVTLSGDAADTDGPTTADGNYTLNAGSGGNLVIAPDKASPPADALNGVSTLDALLVQQYIVGLYTFPDAYKMIAADVNMSNAITTLDASIIRQAILGSPGALDYFINKPWRFVPTTDNTPYSMGYNPGSDPFAAPIPSTRVLTGVTGDAVGENFYGIKTGDVNATGNPENRPENLDPLRLRILDRTLESGQNIYIPVRMGAFDNLAGFQFAFDFDADVLELLSVEPITSPLGLTSANHFGLYNVAAGEIRSAWIDPFGKTVSDDMPVFALRFAVKQSGAKLSEVLRMKPKAISAEAYTVELAVTGIELEFVEEQTTAVLDPITAPGMELLQNRPNPFTERTTIGFTLDQGCDAQLRILDAAGRELLRLDNYYPAGYHEEVILLRDIRATGVLYYELKTPYGTLARKMTALAP